MAENIKIDTALREEPGDLLATGTLAGVGALADPQNFVKVGQVARIGIEKSAQSKTE